MDSKKGIDIMIEVKVPVDIEALQVKGRNGLTPKARNYAIAGVVIVIPLAIWGDIFLHQEVANTLIMLIMALMCMPIYLERGGKNGITGEEMLLNIIHFITNKQMRHYEYLDPIAMIDDKEEALKNTKYKNKVKPSVNNTKQSIF